MAHAETFANMKHLQSLSVQTTLAPDSTPRAVWPAEFSISDFPWPSLTHLVLSNPVPDEQVYAFLPSSLRLLDICCCPHYAEWTWRELSSAYRHEYRYQVLAASSILDILRSMPCRDLTKLAIEYWNDGSEDEMLVFVASSFTGLESLEVLRYENNPELELPLPEVVHRYHPVDASSIPRSQFLSHFASIISPLQHLRELRIHLDLPDCPRLRLQLRPRPMAVEPSIQAVSEMDEALMATARILGTRPSSIECVAFWYPLISFEVEWRTFNVVRNDSGHVTSAFHKNKATQYADIPCV